MSLRSLGNKELWTVLPKSKISQFTILHSPFSPRPSSPPNP